MCHLSIKRPYPGQDSATRHSIKGETQGRMLGGEGKQTTWIVAWEKQGKSVSYCRQDTKPKHHRMGSGQNLPAQ